MQEWTNSYQKDLEKQGKNFIAYFSPVLCCNILLSFDYAQDDTKLFPLQPGLDFNGGGSLGVLQGAVG
jgi:hypothetical protein